jgi:hypothetical protein
MADLVGLDWTAYFRARSAEEIRTLATWLEAQGLQVGEFLDVVDREYATAPRPWRDRTEAFVRLIGRPAAQRYAQRKRHFGRLMALLEAAMLSGALPGDVAPEELDLPVVIPIRPRPIHELLDALERVSHTGA